MVELPPPATDGAWTLDGHAVPDGVLSLSTGPEHCGWQALTILTTGPRPGERFESSTDVRQYVRDPGNRFANLTFRPFEPSVIAPSDAFFTGYRFESMELWGSHEAGDEVVFMVRDGIWERWPRSSLVLACA
jgi:hypothetical protein